MMCPRVWLGLVGLVVALFGCGRSPNSASTGRDAAVGGNSQSTGGTSPSTATGGASSGGIGGSASGGSISAGGGASTVSSGGAGGSPATGGTTGQTGGTSQSTATGGASSGGIGGSASGGLNSAGGGASTVSSGGAGGGPSTGGTAGQGDAGLTDFCTGGAKVAYQGQLVTPPVTSYLPASALNCCLTYGVRLHTQEAIGHDLQVIVDVQVGPSPSGKYPIDGSQWLVRASLRVPSESYYTKHSAIGSVEINGDPMAKAPWQLGLCLEGTDAATDLYGTRVYVPSVTEVGYAQPTPFEFRLLADSTLSASDASLVPLDTLTLAAHPFLTLNDVDFVENSSHWIGLVPEDMTVQSLQTTLGQVGVHGTPFVIQVEGQTLFLGAFMPNISSVGFRGPAVVTDTMVAEGFRLDAGYGYTGTDALADPRVINVNYFCRSGPVVSAGRGQVGERVGDRGVPRVVA